MSMPSLYPCAGGLETLPYERRAAAKKRSSSTFCGGQGTPGQRTRCPYGSPHGGDTLRHVLTRVVSRGYGKVVVGVVVVVGFRCRLSSPPHCARRNLKRRRRACLLSTSWSDTPSSDRALDGQGAPCPYERQPEPGHNGG